MANPRRLEELGTLIDRNMPGIPARLPAPALDQIAFLFHTFSDGQLRSVLSLDGQLDAERLKRAIRLTLDAEPILGCRFVQQRRRPYWERRNDLDRLPLCPIIGCANPHILEGELWRCMVTPMDATRDPIVEACLLRAERDTLVIKIHHSVADGIGVLRYMTILAAIYRELSVNPDYQPRPNLDSRGQGQVIKRVGWLGMLAALRHTQLPAVKPSWGPIATGNDLSGRAFALRRIGPERLRALKAFGHAHGVTMNDILLAAFYRALFDTLDSPVGRSYLVGVPADLRRYLPRDQTVPVCNLVNSAQVAIIRETSTTFDDTLRSVHAAMQAMKSTYPGLTWAVMSELMVLPSFAVANAAVQRLIKRTQPTGSAGPFLSNIGVIDERLLDFGGIEVADAYGLGTVSLPPGLLLAVSTFREIMTLAIGFCNTATDCQLVERFLDRLVGELPA